MLCSDYAVSRIGSQRSCGIFSYGTKCQKSFLPIFLLETSSFDLNMRFFFFLGWRMKFILSRHANESLPIYEALNSISQVFEITDELIAWFFKLLTCSRDPWWALRIIWMEKPGSRHMSRPLMPTANSLSCYGQTRENYPANRIAFTTFERYNTERVGKLPPWPTRIQS